jgi:hypothetical protein
MLPGVSFLDRLRNLLAGPPRIEDAGDPEAAADLQEEYGAPDQGAADLEEIAETGGAYLRGGGYGAAEAAEAAEDDLATEEAPPDPS